MGPSIRWRGPHKLDDPRNFGLCSRLDGLVARSAGLVIEAAQCVSHLGGVHVIPVASTRAVVWGETIPFFR
jgi:hypothetical protein